MTSILKMCIALILACSGFAQTSRISTCEWFIGSDPGQGLAHSLNLAQPDEVEILSLALNSDSLQTGLNRVYVRCQADSVRSGGSAWSRPAAAYVYVLDSAGPGYVHVLTHLKFWLNDSPPTVLDLADAPSLSLSQVLATDSLVSGISRFYLRALDDQGKWSPIEAATLMVISSITQGTPRSITAAEYWVNSDPGPGNGVPIPLPIDSLWGGSQEQESTVLTGLPTGLHLIGVRTRDDLGRWSKSASDSVIIGPILTIHYVGANVVLDWESGDGASLFKIFRSQQGNGPFAILDSTTTKSYTDVNAINSSASQFYHVTFQTSVISNYRLPNAPPEYK